MHHSRRLGGPTRVAAWVALAVAFLPIVALMIDGIHRGMAGAGAQLPYALPTLSRVAGLLLNSLGLAVGVTAAATAIGLALAVWLHVSADRAVRVLRHTYLLPFFLPGYVLALSWLSLSGRRQALDTALAWVFGTDRVMVAAYGFVPTALVLSLALSPLITLFALAGLESVDADLVDEALVLDSPWSAVKRVLLPLIAPSILSGAGIVFALSLVEYTVPSSLQFNVFSMEIYAQFSQDSSAWRAGALALPLVAPAAVALILSQTGRGGAPLRGRLRAVAALTTKGWPIWAVSVCRVAASISVAATIGPVLVLALRAGSFDAVGRAVLGSGRESLLTIAVALSSAIICALLAVPAARAVMDRRSRVVWSAWALPLAIPAPLVGIAVATVSSATWSDWVRDTPLALVLAHVCRLLPFAVIAAAAQVRRVDSSLLEAADLHSVGRWRRFWRIDAPLLMPAAAAAWLVVFVLSLGELGSSLLVVPPGQATLPLRVYTLMHYGAADAVAALALELATVAGVAAVLMAGVRKVVWPWAR